jgi:NAD(P)-dependent dehydrogenase (short-subunit alcohol dehydrogenase family)
MDWFAGATALATGAANGIGRSTAEVLDELGARVIAVVMLVKELAHEFGPHGIRVNAVSPGFVPKAPVPLAVDTERDHRRQRARRRRSVAAQLVGA